VPLSIPTTDNSTNITNSTIGLNDYAPTIPPVISDNTMDATIRQNQSDPVLSPD